MGVAVSGLGKVTVGVGVGVWVGAPGVTGDASVHSGTRVVTNTETTYQTKFLSIIGITALTVTGHAEVNVNRVVDGVAQ